MKKIICILFLLSVTSIIQAAAIQWGSGSPSAKVTASPGGGVLTSYVAYLCVETNAAETLDAVKNGTWNPQTIGVDGNVISKSLIENGIISSGTSSRFDLSITADQEYSFYMVIYDADKGYAMVSSVLTGTPYDEAGFDPASSVKWGNAESLYGTSGGWVAVGVPEPTVLALLALGVAGLALKRRVA